jgi:bifunctional DNase/RNase
MSADLIEVTLRRVVSTGNGFAVFLRGGGKTFVIYVDQEVGAAIAMYREGTPRTRPLTHDLLISILKGLEIDVEKVVINDLRDNTFFARLFLRDDGPEGKRIFEIDARPSDCLAVALLGGAKIYAAPHVLESVSDVGESFADGEK